MTKTEESPDAPLPRLVLRIGVTGHRDLAEGSPAHRRIEQEVRKALETMCRSLERVATQEPQCFRAATPLLRVISPLAEGADRLVATTLLGLKGACAVDLQCPLPFPVAAYEEDFATADSKSTFHGLLGRASTVVALDGVREQGEPDAMGPSPAGLGYEAVGEYVLEHSDVLIAIWDGKPARGTGGTAEVVARAGHLGLPVLHIPAGTIEGDPRVLYVSEADLQPSDGTWTSTLGDLVADLVLPPGDARLDLLRQPTGDQREQELRQRTRLTQWFEEPNAPRRSLYERIWGTFMRLLGWGAVNPRPSYETPEAIERAMKPFRRTMDRADRLAGHYGGIYRGAFLLNYLLGATAVVLALASVLIPVQSLRLTCGVLELVALLWILFNVRRGKTSHKRFLDYRLLAEQLRHTLYLYPLGRLVPGFRIPAHHATHDPRREWTNWVYQSTVREVGLPKPPEGESVLRVDAAYVDQALDTIRHDWIGGQIAYHERTADRSHRIAERLEHAVWALAILTLVLCALHLVLEALHPTKGWQKHLMEWLPFLLAGLPALLAALHGIRSQGEFVRLALRSVSMQWQLTKLQQRLDGLEARDDVPFSRRVASEAVNVVAQQMIDEAIDWRILAKIQEVGPA